MHCNAKGIQPWFEIFFPLGFEQNYMHRSTHTLRWKDSATKSISEFVGNCDSVWAGVNAYSSGRSRILVVYLDRAINIHREREILRSARFMLYVWKMALNRYNLGLRSFNLLQKASFCLLEFWVESKDERVKNFRRGKLRSLRNNIVSCWLLLRY